MGSTKSTGAFAFDMSRWSQPERLTAIATLVLLISLFLPWYTYGGGSVDGLWHGWMYLTFILCIAVLVYLVARASYKEMPFKLPIAEEQFLLLATGISFVLTVIAFLDKPGGYGFGGIGWGFGSFVGLIAAIVAAAPLGVPAIKARRG